MINRHIIQVILMDHNINKVFTRGTIDDYHNNYLSSFYIPKCNIKRNNVEFKKNGQNKIIKTLEYCLENNEYSQLTDVSITIKRTLYYIKLLKNSIEAFPEEIDKAIHKYLPIVESNKINGVMELNTLINISHNIVNKIKRSGYFDNTEKYKNVLLSLNVIINEINNSKVKTNEKIDLLKHTYKENEKYLKEYVADISAITNEIDIASNYLNELFKKVRLIGVTTCQADQFIENKKSNVNNYFEYEITNITDIKYKKLYLFSDNSILFEDINFNLLEVIDNDHLDKIQNEIMFNSIGIEFKKYPTIEKLFKTAIIKKPDYLNRIIGIADQYKKYKNLLKDSDFKIVNEIITYINSQSGYEMLEEIRVKINKITKTNNIKVFAYSIASKKYKNLYDDNVMVAMELLYDLKIKKEILQEQIGAKIAAYNTPEDFCNGLMKLYDIISNFTKEQILDKVKKTNTKINYENDDLIILEINSFLESSFFGAPSWCISRDEEYFRSYAKNGCKQYIIYNFKKETPTRETLIGITINNKTVKAANYRNNDNINRNDKILVDLIELIKS